MELSTEFLDKLDYFVLDAARIGRMLNDVMDFDLNIHSLYKYRSEEALADVAPYLIDVKNQLEFLSWYFEKGWGDSWGIFINSSENFENIFKHLRKFLIVQDEKGEELYFRFYDPRVLNDFFDVIEEEQAKEFFSGVNMYITETEIPGIANSYLYDKKRVIKNQISIIFKLKEIEFLQNVVEPEEIFDDLNLI